MPEGNVNSEVAEHLREHGHHSGGNGGARRRLEWVEILEAILLSLVALATAWSGYQAAKWDGESAREYATSSRLRAESSKASLSSNQTLIYNAGTFNAWLQADVSGEKKLADILARRYTPEYKVAFDAWLKLDPLHNPKAPPGPRYMPQYKDPLAAKGSELDQQATEAFAAGVDDRASAEHYVRVTVVLAAVLFLIALGQRFDFRGVRIAVISVAGVFLVYAAVLMLTYPHA
jgi:hypothetical protein